MIYLLASDTPTDTKSTFHLMVEAFFLILLFLFVMLKLDRPAMLTSITVSGLCLIISMVELKKQKTRFTMVLLSVIVFVVIYFKYKNVFNPFNDTAYCLIACCMLGVIAAFRKRFIHAIILFAGVIYSIVRTQAIVNAIHYQPEYRTHSAIRWWWVIGFVIFMIAGYTIQIILGKFIEHGKMKKVL